MRILALDPATNCGWAHTCGQSGTWDLSVRRDESGGMRLVRFRSKLRELKELEGIDVLVFEAARHAGPGMQGALVVQSEIQGVLKEWCETESVQYRGYSPSEIKKHATGKGNAKKADMQAAAAERFGRSMDDNEADALWLLDLAKRDLVSDLPSSKAAAPPAKE